MRLLNVHTLEFHTFLGDDVPNYSIASHRWVSDESSIKDIIKRRNTESNGYKKVEGFCAYVRQANELYKDTYPDLCCDFLWIDTCCIDQKSSLEVDTAIRSMFQWYNKSVICYAYLADVEPQSAGTDAVEASFRNSVWFSRGWTLQELLAPRTVVFLTKKWEVIGHKCTSTAITDGGQCPGVGGRLNGMISEISGIPELVLYDYPRSKELSIEERMSWAAKRKTTRQEDSVYCLLGIFEIHMPVMYGEGDFAQIRLRSEIEKKVEAWEKGQKAGVQTTYNKTAPCAVLKSTSHLPTVSQAAHGHLPAPIDNSTTPSDVMVTSARQDTVSSQATSQQGSSDAGASEAADELRALNVGQRGATPRVPVKGASTPGSTSSRPDDEENFKPPPRSMTFNTWREPYTRRNSPGQGVTTTSWAAEPEEMEAARNQGGVPPMPPPRANPPPIPSQKAPSPPVPQRTQQSAVSRGPEPSAPSSPPSLPLSDAPPPDYDSIWDGGAAQQPSQQPRTQQASYQVAQSSYQQPIRQAENYQPPAKSPSWSTSQDSFGTAPSRAQTWSTAMTDTGPSSRNDNWSPPGSEYPMPTLEDIQGYPNTTTQSNYGGFDVPLSSRAQRRLEHTIAREERKEKRRERHRSKKSGAAGTVAGSTRGDDDYDSEGDDLVSTTGSSFSRSTDPRSASTGGQAPPPMPNQQGSHMYDVVQDARRQDARRRFFENGGKDKPRAGSTSSGGKNSATERSLSDLADSLPSGLRLTKTALRMLDSKSPTLGNGEGAADQQTVAPSEAGTATTRTKPVGRRELKQILKDQKGSASQDQDGKKLSARDRLLGAVSSHLRNG